MSKHTPGPWTYEVVGIGGKHDDPADVCEITNGHTRIAEYVWEADARLIAAAPDLLAALIYLRDCIESGREPGMGDVHRAIAKATGETP